MLVTEPGSEEKEGKGEKGKGKRKRKREGESEKKREREREIATVRFAAATAAGRRRAARCAERGKERYGTTIAFGCRDGENFREGIRRIRARSEKGFRNDLSPTMKENFENYF